MMDIYLITGFLGAGKTTLMKNLIGAFENSKVAMIVNEFGQQDVDGCVLEQEGMVIEQIVDGSIFCVCRSDKFIEVILKTKELNIDYLIVESSGLADPFGMPSIMSIVNKLAPNNFHYSGSICVVDTTNFFKVYEVASAVKQQIQGADLLIINKTDIASSGEVEKIEQFLRQLNTYAEIIKTTFSKIIDKDLIYSLQWHNPDMKGVIIKKTLGVSKFTLKFKEIPLEELVNWLKTWTENVFRVKGFCRLNNNGYYVQAVQANIDVSKLDSVIKDNFLVVLGPARDSIKDDIQKSWGKQFSSTLEIV